MKPRQCASLVVGLFACGVDEAPELLQTIQQSSSAASGDTSGGTTTGTVDGDTSGDTSSSATEALDMSSTGEPTTGDLPDESACSDGVVPRDDPDAFDTCAPDCMYPTRLVFVTSTATSGDLGGFAGADQRCNDLAAAAGLPGTYRAWLLRQSQSIVDRFPEFFGLQTQVHFLDVAGALLARSMPELILCGPDRPIARDEHGAPRPERPVWTNVMSSGLNSTDCGQWSSATGEARVGHTGFLPDTGPGSELWHARRQWTDVGVSQACSDAAHLYCVQVTDE